MLLYLNSSLMLSDYLQQTTSGDDIFRYSFCWRFKGKVLIYSDFDRGNPFSARNNDLKISSAGVLLHILHSMMILKLQGNSLDREQTAKLLQQTTMLVS